MINVTSKVRESKCGENVKNDEKAVILLEMNLNIFQDMIFFYILNNS